MRADRLLSIIWLLRVHGALPAAELARRLEVSRRTVLRDVEALSSAGVPVYCERGRHGGVRLLPGYRTDVTGLNEEESRALFAAVTTWGAESLGLGEALASGLRKLLAAVPEQHRDASALVSERIVIDQSGWLPSPEAERQEAVLHILQQAVLGERRVRLTYRSRGRTSAVPRIVDPHGLVAAEGTWYLCATEDGHPAEGSGQDNRAEGSDQGHSAEGSGRGADGSAERDHDAAGRDDGAGQDADGAAGRSLPAHDGSRLRFFRLSRVEEAVGTEDVCRTPRPVDLRAVWREHRRSFLERFEECTVVAEVREHAWTMIRERVIHAERLPEDEATASGEGTKCAGRSSMSAPAAPSEGPVPRIPAESAEPRWQPREQSRVGEDEEDPWLLARLTFVDAEHALAVVMQLGADVRVLEPFSLRDEIVRHARGILDAHGG